MSQSSPTQVRLAILGVGSMGSVHARHISEGKVPRMTLGALVDLDPAATQAFPDVPKFANLEEFWASNTADAVLIATPHYDHTTLGIAALEKGFHVLVEKPISVHKADCQRLIAAHTNPKQKFAAMFNQRTDPFYQKIRSLIQSGELGQIRRINWIITNWFRTEAYYASGGWRATWGGEGGGVLLNQCPHNLDLYQWMFGMPQKLRSWCALGKYHNIEVEDDVTTFMQYDSGATGVFITSTGEAPGTNRLEITAEQGRLVYEHDLISYKRNEQAMTHFSQTTDQRFSTPSTWDVTIPVRGHGGQHIEITTNFAEAILDDKPLIAPAAEGIHSVELANAMLLSAFENREVNLPLDPEHYEAVLKEKIASSTFKKVVRDVNKEDFASSFR
ncbi:MAG: Gfo/Idh/MocA family protein [Verrucomicrobiales bacterium]